MSLLQNPRGRWLHAATMLSAATLMIAAAWLARSTPQKGNSKADAGIDATVERMVECAVAANVECWLECLTGPARRRAESRLAVVGRDRFAQELRSESQNLTSYVTTNWVSQGEDEASVDLEQVFRDHNRRWRLRVVRSDLTWRIHEQTSLDAFAPDIPYGTQVSPTTTATDEASP